MDVDDDANGMKDKEPTTPKKEEPKPAYPVSRYPKGAKAIFEGKTTISEIEKMYTVSDSAKAVVMAHVLNMEEKAAEEAYLKTELIIK